MHPRRHPRLRVATAIAILTCLLVPATSRAGSKLRVAAIGDKAPGGGQFLGPSLGDTPAAAGNGWVVFRSLVTNGGTSEQVVAKNMVPGTVAADASTYVVAQVGQSAGKADGKDLGSFKQFLGQPAINANGDVAFVATLSTSDRLPAPGPDDLLAIAPAGLFVYRRSVQASQPHLQAVALARTDFGPLGQIDFASTIDILNGSLTAIDVAERTPALNDAGDVAFAAATQGTNTFSGAIFFAPAGGGLAPVVRLQDPIGDDRFGIVGQPAMNNAGTIVFHGFLDRSGTEGVFQYAGGTTTALVTSGRKVITTQPFPLEQTIDEFGSGLAINDQGDVAFSGGPLIDANIDSNDLDGAPGVFVLRGGTLSMLAYPGQPVPARGRITDIALGPEGNHAIAAPTLAADGSVVFFAELNTGKQQALFRVAPPYDTTVLLPYVVLGGSDPDPTPIGGVYQAAGSAPVSDAQGNVSLVARVTGATTSEALLFLARNGADNAVIVGDPTPRKGAFGGPPFSNIVATDAGDVVFKSYLAAGTSALGYFRWSPTGNPDTATSLIVRAGDAAPLAGAPRIVDLVGDPGANAHGDVAFAAIVDGVGRVLFERTDAGIEKIAAPGDTLPSPPAPADAAIRSVATGPSVLPDGSVVFRATYDYPDPLIPFSFLVEDGLFVADPAGGLRLLARTGQLSPAGTPFLRLRDSTAGGGQSIALRSTLGGRFDLDPPLGLFVVDPSTTIRRIAVQNDTEADGLAVHGFSGKPAVDAAGNVAFLGDVTFAGHGGNALVRTGADGSRTVLAQVGQQGPTGGRLKGLSRPAMSSAGHIAFRASFEALTGGTPGFFLARESDIVPLVILGESDNQGRGGRLSSLNPSASLNASDQIAFIGSVSEGQYRNGIFLASPATATAEALSGRIRETSLSGAGRDTIRGRVTLDAGNGDGFDLAHDAVTIALSDGGATYFNTTVSGKRLVRSANSLALKGRQGPLRALRVRVRRKIARVSFAAAGLDFFAVAPPFTIRVDVGNDSGVVRVSCTIVDGTRIACPLP